MRKCVIFDLDGTLTRSEEGIWNCVRYAAEKLGFPVPDAATLRKFIGPPLGWSFMEYMGMSEEMANKAVSTYRERYEAVGLFENRVYPGIRRLLRTLHRDGWYIGIATGKPQRSSERIIEHFGLNRYITKIVGPKDGRGADKELLIRQALPEDAGEAWMAWAPVCLAAAMILSATRYDSREGAGPSSTASSAICTWRASLSASE